MERAFSYEVVFGVSRLRGSDVGSLLGGTLLPIFPKKVADRVVVLVLVSKSLLTTALI